MRKSHYAAMLAVGALSLSACSSGGGGGGAGGTADVAKPTVQQITLGTAADSQGPAPAVDGAKKGGTVNDLEQSDFNHLDPGQLYVSNQQAIAPLYSRTLTNYKVDPKSGKTTLVGDLATDTGEASADKKTWTYHLKDGLKYEDGSAITSQDIKYGIERLYADFETEGPIYVQTWLSGTDYRKAYQGPYSGKDLPDSVISTPDDKTIVFHFQAPHADTPYAMQMPNISPIPKAKDTKQKYDLHPVSTGPYKIETYNPGKSLVLARNTNWDPKTDPIRDAYPDKWNFEISIPDPGLTQRLMAESGQDKYSLTLSQSANPTQMATILGDPKYKSRTVNQYQPFVDVLSINTSRVKDARVRQAIEYAFPMKQIQQTLGGEAQGEIGTNLMSPTIGGYKSYDPFDKVTHPNGDPEKAKALLKEAGVSNLKLTLAFANNEKWQNFATTLKNGLAKAGIDLQLQALDLTSYYTLVGKVNNPYDLYRTGWGADWSNGSTVLPPTEDGRQVADGLPNYSHLNDSHVNSEIDRINAITDLKQQQAAWEQLSEYIVKNDVPSIPYFYDKFFQIYGDGLGGVTYNQNIGVINANTVYVK
ncbi:ABC transporter substrate-binding protein [Streptantibioticus ferralitis]|uniref:ABC transporter substrate-binding protein n=1 Tax=Streptantibioticus ferralitis TaxID=236510 RepID=A0ABT5YTB9_9ACTN|nr:ABC transporter substrate-binding protein [Streptantibioticus ferralitis]MDF2254703.1 ABC transporter substrate-binding protein [Streptantibioticus ferralitis]